MTAPDLCVPKTAVLDLAALRKHLDEFVADDPSALVFTGPRGDTISRGNFRKLTVWTKTVAEGRALRW